MEKQFNPFSLEGKLVMVTGASSGIGRQCAIDCNKMGAKVMAVGRDLDRLNTLMAEMEGENDCFSFDLKDLSGIKALIETIVERHGKLDGFIHSAGIEVTNPIKLSKPDDFETLYRLNCVSAFEIVRNLCGIKTFNRGGSIVFISSITGLIARKGLSAYAASKGALVSAAKVFALEMAPREIRVNAVLPGTVMTPMIQKEIDAMDDEQKKNRMEGFPLGLGRPTDVSNACIYLLSDASRWVTGSSLVVDGGYIAC